MFGRLFVLNAFLTQQYFQFMVDSSGPNPIVSWGRSIYWHKQKNLELTNTVIHIYFLVFWVDTVQPSQDVKAAPEADPAMVLECRPSDLSFSDIPPPYCIHSTLLVTHNPFFSFSHYQCRLLPLLRVSNPTRELTVTVLRVERFPRFLYYSCIFTVKCNHLRTCTNVPDIFNLKVSNTFCT